MSRAEQRVARFFQDNREEVMISSAAALAEKTNTSDATVVRTTQALGYSGLEELRRALAGEMRAAATLPKRLSRTVLEVGNDAEAAFEKTLQLHLQALESIRGTISLQNFRQTIDLVVNASRVVVFGLGPSNAIAQYFTVQLSRFGFATLCLEKTGLLFADELHQLREGDLIIVLAYDRLYVEIEVLLAEARRKKLGVVLITDSLQAQLEGRVKVILSVSRGRADLLSMHTATMGLFEMLLVGIAGKAPARIESALEQLNTMRKKLTGQSLKLPK
jgi:DNA-binding MurR/RpiR family transcriptional regulator